jgi:DNA-binding LacI/PurR family transcriptional regulator
MSTPSDPAKKKSIRRRPKRQTIKDSIKSMIEDGDLSVGDQIQSQNTLAEHYGTAPMTVYLALQELVKEGIIERRRGVGTFVKDSGKADPGVPKKICLILHKSGLESPEVNPIYWPQVQFLLAEFNRVLSDKYVFNMIFAEAGKPLKDLLNQIKGYHAVFFHYTDEIPVDTIRGVIESKVAPVIHFGRPNASLPCMHINNDRFEDIRTATEYLVKKKYRRIGLICSTDWWGDLALAGFRHCLYENGIPDQDVKVIRIKGDVLKQGTIDRLVFKSGRICEGVVVDTDILGAALSERLQERGYKVPEDVSIISYGGVHSAVSQYPFLTTVKIPYGEMVLSALSLIERYGSHLPPVPTISISGEVVEGKTVRK